MRRVYAGTHRLSVVLRTRIGACRLECVAQQAKSLRGKLVKVSFWVRSLMTRRIALLVSGTGGCVAWTSWRKLQRSGTGVGLSMMSRSHGKSARARSSAEGKLAVKPESTWWVL